MGTMCQHMRPDAQCKGSEKGRGTDREAMEGAIRLVMRSVAVTLTLIMVASSSVDVSTKSVGNSWDTPTLLTVLLYTAACARYTKSALPFLLVRKERRGRTEYADFDRLELLEERLPSRVVRRCKVDNERLGLYTFTTTCLDYIPPRTAF